MFIDTFFLVITDNAGYVVRRFARHQRCCINQEREKNSSSYPILLQQEAKIMIQALERVKDPKTKGSSATPETAPPSSLANKVLVKGTKRLFQEASFDEDD